MFKSVHKSKPNKISGEKLTCGGRNGRQNAEKRDNDVSRRCCAL